MVPGLAVGGLGVYDFRFNGLGFWGLGFRGLRFRGLGPGQKRVYGLGFRYQDPTPSAPKP